MSHHKVKGFAFIKNFASPFLLLISVYFENKKRESGKSIQSLCLSLGSLALKTRK
jgi:hypothetical protein